MFFSKELELEVLSFDSDPTKTKTRRCLISKIFTKTITRGFSKNQITAQHWKHSSFPGSP
jgi:hypothetical protein